MKLIIRGKEKQIEIEKGLAEWEMFKEDAIGFIVINATRQISEAEAK